MRFQFKRGDHIGINFFKRDNNCCILFLAICGGFGRSGAAGGGPLVSQRAQWRRDNTGAWRGMCAAIRRRGRAHVMAARRLLDHALPYKISKNHTIPLIFEDFHWFSLISIDF